MNWSEISIHTSHEAVEAVSEILLRAGAGGVAIEDSQWLTKDWPDTYGEIYDLSEAGLPQEGVVVKAYFPVNDSILPKVAEIEQEVRDLVAYGLDIGKGIVSTGEIAEEQWATAWKQYYRPVHVSDHITIKPSWEDYQTPAERAGEIVIELDPGMAFGTGTHPTTTLSMQALEKVVKPGDVVIDVGCGSGVLSITAAKLGASHVLALDLDEVAVKATESNVKENGVGSIVTAQKNNLLQGVTKSADIIVANILADVIIRLTRDAAAALKPAGAFVVSGIISSRENDVRSSLEDAGFGILETIYRNDWVAMIAEKV